MGLFWGPGPLLSQVSRTFHLEAANIGPMILTFWWSFLVIFLAAGTKMATHQAQLRGYHNLNHQGQYISRPILHQEIQLAEGFVNKKHHCSTWLHGPLFDWALGWLGPPLFPPPKKTPNLNGILICLKPPNTVSIWVFLLLMVPNSGDHQLRLVVCPAWWFQPNWKILVKLDHFPR